MHKVLERLKDGRCTVTDLVRDRPAKARAFYARSLLWLAKMGLVQIRRR